MSNKPEHVNLHALIHEEQYQLARERLVFEIANAIALAFNIRGTGTKLQYLLDESSSQTDAEILIRWVNQALLTLQQENQSLLVGQLIDQLTQACRNKGIAA